VTSTRRVKYSRRGGSSGRNVLVNVRYEVAHLRWGDREDATPIGQLGHESVTDALWRNSPEVVPTSFISHVLRCSVCWTCAVASHEISPRLRVAFSSRFIRIDYRPRCDNCSIIHGQCMPSPWLASMTSASIPTVYHPGQFGSRRAAPQLASVPILRCGGVWRVDARRA
jgi:hypothetical protein